MNRFEITVDIAAPASKVWEILTDVERWPEWTASMRQIIPLTPGALGLRSKYRVIQPKVTPLVYDVTVFEPHKTFIWTARSFGLQVWGEHWILPSSTPGQTQVKLVFQQSGFLEPLIHLLFAELTHKYMALEAAGLKQRSESLK